MLFNPLEGPPGGWPDAAKAERAYLEGFARLGSEALIANLRTQICGLRSGEHVLPVTINDAEYGDAYVCLPHTAYALYAKEELRLVDVGAWRPALAWLASGAGALMRSARINQIVHVDNWMLSTNLHDAGIGQNLGAIRQLLVERFPKHLIAIRCLNDWSDAKLLDQLRRDGWRLLPSRQIYVWDDLAAGWAPHRDSRRDLSLLERTPYRLDSLAQLRPGDSRRIADLYSMLYLDRYSKLNPTFTEAYVELTHRDGILVYRGLRDGSGQLATVVGCLVRGGVLTTPIVGYDTGRPSEDGLYRMASVLFAQEAMKRGLRLNGSAGAAGFKRNRGARPVTEYGAYFVDHLSMFRRSVISGIETVLNRVAAPMLSEKGL